MAKAPLPKEWQLHGYAADLLRLNAKRGVLWFHVPNEGRRPARSGAFLKRLGMLPGVADLVVVVKGKAHFLELKTAKGEQSVNQVAFAAASGDAGCPYALVRTPEGVRATLEMWGAVWPLVAGSAVRRAA